MIQKKRFRSFRSFRSPIPYPELITDSSDTWWWSRRSHSPPLDLCAAADDRSKPSKVTDEEFERRLDAAEPRHVSSPPSLAAGEGGARIPCIGRTVPPARTVSTAAWHTCQFPLDSSPTAPLTGLTVRPHASNSSD